MLPAMTAKRTLVFVYGTLKRGGAWNHLLRDAEFLGSGMTVDRRPMIIDGIPYLLDEDAGHQVRGELFGVDASTLRALDSLEGNGRWYERRIKTVVVSDERYDAFIYFLMSHRYHDVGDWRARTHHAIFPID